MCSIIGSKCYRRLSACWKRTPKLKIVLLLVSLIFPVVSISCVAAIQFSLTDQLIAVGQTIVLQPGGYFHWCAGFLVSEHVVEYSDYHPGFDVSAFLVDSYAVKTESVTVRSDKYPGVNLPINYDKQRYLIPLNYYSDPLYFLKGSTITVRSVISLPRVNANELSYALVYVFDSEKEAAKYEQGKTSAKKSVGYINVTDCVSSVCSLNYSVGENAFLFFVLSSDATTAFNITTNFTFQVLRFVYPFSHSHAWNVANISKNVSGFIPFMIGKLHKEILLHTNAPNSTEMSCRLGHLNITCTPRQWFHASVIVVSLVPLLVYCVVLVGCCFCTKKAFLVLRYQQFVQRLKRRKDTLDANAPLLQ